jgi:hypothetical protein
MATTNRTEPRRAGAERESVADEDEEVSWLLAAALISARRQGDPRPREAVMGALAQMSVERGAGTVALAAVGLADVAAALLEVCADSLRETPETVIRDVLAILRDDS